MVFNLKACYPYPAEFGPNYPKTILVCRFFIYYAVPLSIIAFFYILMARHLIHSTRNIPGEMQCQVSGKKVLKMGDKDDHVLFLQMKSRRAHN